MLLPDVFPHFPTLFPGSLPELHVSPKKNPLPK